MAVQAFQGSKAPVPQILRDEYQIYVVSADGPCYTEISLQDEKGRRNYEAENTLFSG